MAQTPLRHRLTVPRPRWNADNFARQATAFRVKTQGAYRRDPRLFLWRLLWLPFWLGSDAPTAGLPSRMAGPADTIPTDPAGQHLTTRIDRITRRFGIAWTAGSTLRGLTLALLVSTIWAGLAVAGLTSLPGWRSVAGLAVAGVVLGGGYGWLARPDRLMVARMFDRTFGLRERIVTAFDRPADPRHVSRLQLADAANTFDEISAEIPRSAYLPIREVALCLIVTGALVTVLLAHVPGQAIATVGESPVPQFVPASERLAVREQPAPAAPVAEQPVAEQATIAEIQERGRQSQSAREDLARLGAALEQHPITQPAAESIASGDYAPAAESLRAASESAGAMAPESREALAEDLEAAAQEISAENPELAQAANDAAAALREGGPEAETALDSLADQVEETGGEVESQENLARDLDEAQSGSGDSSASSDEGSQGESSGENQSQSPAESGSGDEAGAAADPGEGSAAQPGVANQPQESSESAAGAGESEGSGEQGEGEGSSSEGAGEAPSDAPAGEGSGEPSSEEASSEGDGSGSAQSGLQGAPDDETSASQGSGAGTGQRGANDQNTSDQAVADPAAAGQENPEAEVPGVGEAGDPPPSRADRGEADDGTGTSSQGSTNLELQGVSDSGVQTGGDSGSSSLGSGSGSTTASGDETGGQVGVAGPDSNRAPDDLRDVVRDFFGGPEE